MSEALTASVLAPALAGGDARLGALTVFAELRGELLCAFGAGTTGIPGIRLSGEFTW